MINNNCSCDSRNSNRVQVTLPYLFADTQVFKPEPKQKEDKPTDKVKEKEELPELSDALTD